MWCYNCQIMPSQDVEQERNQTKKFRRQVWLQIYFPIVFGIFILGILVVSLSLNQTGTASVWADASLVLILIPALILGLIFLLILIALSYLVVRLVDYLPTPMNRIRVRVKIYDQSTRRLARTISRPFLFPSAVKAAIGAVFRGLASVFK